MPFFQKSDPPEAAPLLAPCLKVDQNSEFRSTFSRDVIFQESDPPEAAPLLAPCLKIENAVQTVGSQSRKLPSRQGFRQYFQYFEFSFYEPGLKSKTFYIVGRCASVWRGPGFFWSCICGERGNLKLGFLPVGFHKIRRATGF